MITFSNDFHNTTVRVRPKDGRISVSQARRAWRELCGIRSCTCGGIRGRQAVDYEEQADGSLIILADV